MVSLGLFFLRLVVGAIFMAHGVPKLIGGPGKGEALSATAKQVMGERFVSSMDNGGVNNFANALESMDVPNPKRMAWLVALLEGVGGLFLILGFKTRPIAAGLAVSQVVGIQKVHAKDGFVGGYEFNASLIGATAALALAGAGKIAID